jgi:hypothetical protein
VDVKVFTRENGDELNPGVNEVVRCYIAQKRKISVGTKWRAAMETRALFPHPPQRGYAVFTRRHAS